MCGITGYYTSSKKQIAKDALQVATNTMSHRGPDDAGYYVDENVGLGHRRLSIIDLSSAGHQPMTSAYGRYIIAYNGEIYNYLQLKEELELKGFLFRGCSDTEVVVNGFEYWGNAVFEKLNGIFAISIWDKQENKLTLARDRMGVKPLYYWYENDLLLFGSEIKSILSYGFVQRKIDNQSFHEFLYYGYALGENTMFSRIKKVLPGHYIEISRDKMGINSFWSHKDIRELSLNQINERDAISQTRLLLENAVSRQLISDVPVGIFLSGGIDSSAITAFASRHYNGKVKTFSTGFDFDNGHNELPLAAKIAKQFGTEHNEMIIYGKDVVEIIKTMVRCHDEPFSDAANIPLYLMSQCVKDDCKVILQGDGGDELFAGYPRYHIMAKYSKYKLIFSLLHSVKPIIPFKYIKAKTERFYPLFDNQRTINKFAKFLTEEVKDNPEDVLSTKIKSKLISTSPFNRYNEVEKEMNFLTDDVQKLLWIDTQIILPDQFLEKVDKSTMANGVEVRVPFLDNEIVSFALSLPSDLKVKNGVKKYLLKKALDGILPNEVLYGPKKGFGVPYQNWLRDPLKDFMNEIFYDEDIVKLGIFNYQILNTRINEHITNKKNWGFSLWKMLNLCIWIKAYDVTFE
ncbi:MAG TPA: asparagine synthase (glutamine-hydrolyzing) [Saprospiraceae bacterium]|nr:asparagine synthase (glutamine-hydrolyzing) [Saprospiraceae bacterium]HRP40802.1 asparagine synthase (glutamine-hydrolyzing) [Saprospiraceae bacterium]